MNHSLSHLSDGALLQHFSTLVSRERSTAAELLAYLAEIDARKLYLPAGYSSMYLYCVHEMHLSEDAAFRRITAARAARQYPAIFTAVAEGSLHLSAVNLLAPYLTAGTADELLTAAAHKTKAETERLLAERFPRSDVLTLVQTSSDPLVPGPVEAGTNDDRVACQPNVSSASCQLVPGRVGTSDDRRNVSQLSAQSVALQVTLERSTYDLLCYAQQLLGHQVSSGDVPQVLDRALKALVRELEKRKLAATAKPRASRAPAAGSRHVPAAVKRAVWERDGGQCTFVSDAGQHCQARERLEFDHVLEVARGGEATVDGIRLRCRAHNQYTAERTFGAGFMTERRRAASEARERARQERARAAEARRRAAAEARQREMEARAGENDADRSVVPWLRALGYSAAQARSASELCDDIPDAPIEERVRAALSRDWRKTHPRMYPSRPGHAEARA